MSPSVTLDTPRTTAVDPTSSRPVSSRRRLLLGVGAATLATGVVQAACATSSYAAEDDSTLHLLRRATFGPTPAMVAAVRGQGASAWLDAQLNPGSIADSTMDGLLKRWPRLGLKTWEWREQVTETNRWDLMYDVVESQLARALWSERQLFEVTADFWTNHLVIPTPSSEVYDSAHLFQRDVIRKFTFGKYADMLAAAARHPAMLNILDNALSSKKAPNENYGRELLELHTVGVGNYSEADVKASALALTGLAVDAESGLYEFKPWRRFVGAVKVMGWSSSNTSAEGGEAVALSYLSYLARHPKTAERIATKLCVRFVADSAPASLVAKLAQVYLDNDTAIAPVLKALFTSEEFAASAGKKVKTPLEDTIATMRVLGVGPQTSGTTELRNLFWTLGTMGQAPLGWPAPNGYPDVAPAWAGAASTLARFNHHVRVAGGWSLTTMPRPSLNDLLPKTLPTTYAGYLEALATRLFLTPLSSTQQVAICTFLGKKPTDALKSSDAALSWQLKYVVAILLDSFNFAVR